MEIINTSNLNEARKQIQKLKNENKEIIIKAQDDEFNRKILENSDISILLSPELENKRDKLKQRDSGLNEVNCKLATKNKITIGIDLKPIINLNSKDKAKILARISQNITLCKRTKTKIKLFNHNNKKQAFSLLLTLGADTKMAKEAI